MSELGQPVEARWYVKRSDGRVHCHLCHQACLIADGDVGFCHVRRNAGGTLYTLAYGRTIARNVDPIEKKPLFHFMPGSTSFSVATPGCNFRCLFCQNADISQVAPSEVLDAGQPATPAELVEAARRYRCRSIAYTYTEPTIFSEYAHDIAALAHSAGLANVFVTNGYMTRRLLDDMQPYLDAANVDLKSFRDAYYQEMCAARLRPVLDSLRYMKRLGMWVEVTTLLVTGANDDPGELRELASFIAGDLGPDTPWHISRFHPTYRLRDRGSTPLGTLEMARQIGADAGLHHIYMGNVPGNGEDTHCPHCGALVVRRFGFEVLENRIDRAACAECGKPIAGRWQ